MLNTVADRMRGLGIELSATDAAIDKLADAGFDPVYGARPLRRAIQSKVEDTVAEEMLEGRISSGSRVTIDLDGDKIVAKTE